MYSHAFRRFDDQFHYFYTLGVGASGLAYGLQVSSAVVLLLWTDCIFYSYVTCMLCCVYSPLTAAHVIL